MRLDHGAQRKTMKNTSNSGPDSCRKRVNAQPNRLVTCRCSRNLLWHQLSYFPIFALCSSTAFWRGHGHIINQVQIYHSWKILLVPCPTKILRCCSDSIAMARCILRLASARTSSVTAERAKSSEHLAFAIGPGDFQCDWDSQYFPVNPTWFTKTNAHLSGCKYLQYIGKHDGFFPLRCQPATRVASFIKISLYKGTT